MRTSTKCQKLYREYAAGKISFKDYNKEIDKLTTSQLDLDLQKKEVKKND